MVLLTTKCCAIGKQVHQSIAGVNEPGLDHANFRDRVSHDYDKIKLVIFLSLQQLPFVSLPPCTRIVITFAARQ